jgi:uncharacterized membrane protein HdeD (DUF308 family)
MDSNQETPMTTATKTEDRNRRERSGHPHGWGVPMAIGILLIIGGAFALVASVLTSIVTIIYVGAMLLVVGALEIVSAFRVRGTGPLLIYFLAGVLAFVIGGLFLYRPFAGLASLTLLIAGYLFAGGLFRGITAIAIRYPRWGWNLAYAIVALALGVYVIVSWPLSSFWVLGTVVAVEIIARGFALVAASWVLRDREHHGGMPGGFAAV